MSKKLKRFFEGPQPSRNQLMEKWECGRQMLQILEDLAIDLIPDFRQSLSYPEAIGYRHTDGSVSACIRRSAEFSPYHIWVLSRLLELRRKCRKQRKSNEEFEASAFRLSKKLSMENYLP